MELKHWREYDADQAKTTLPPYTLSKGFEVIDWKSRINTPYAEVTVTMLSAWLKQCDGWKRCPVAHLPAQLKRDCMGYPKSMEMVIAGEAFYGWLKALRDVRKINNESAYIIVQQGLNKAYNAVNSSGWRQVHDVYRKELGIADITI